MGRVHQFRGPRRRRSYSGRDIKYVAQLVVLGSLMGLAVFQGPENLPFVRDIPQLQSSSSPDWTDFAIVDDRSRDHGRPRQLRHQGQHRLRDRRAHLPRAWSGVLQLHRRQSRQGRAVVLLRAGGESGGVAEVEAMTFQDELHNFNMESIENRSEDPINSAPEE